MVNKARDRLHKVTTTYMDRAQASGFDDWPKLASLDPKRLVGLNKSPFSALQFGTRGAHLRTPREIRSQYDTIIRALLRELSHHFESKVHASTDFGSLVHNLIELEVMRYWNQQANDPGEDGRHAGRPVGRKKLDHDVQVRVLEAVKAVLNDDSDGVTIPPALRALIPGREAVDALSVEQSWSTPSFREDMKFSLPSLQTLIGTEGIDGNVMSDELLAEFGLNTSNRKDLGPEMAKYRLFGKDGRTPATVQNFLNRALHIRNTNDVLKPETGEDGNAITAMKEFNDIYIREEPMGPRVRAQDGGVYGFNNVGLALTVTHVYIAPNPTFANDRRAFVEYNSGGHAFEVAYGVQRNVSLGLGASAGHGFLLPDGTIVAGTGTMGAVMDWTNQEAIRLRGRRELNANGEALVVADDPGGDNHGRQLAAAYTDGGVPLMADESGRLATATSQEDGSTRYLFQDNNQVVIKTAAGAYMNERGEPLLKASGSPLVKQFGKAYVYSDTRQPANDVARMDKARFHLMQATDFVFRHAEQARDSGNVGTSAQLWNEWVDEFFDNRNVSISYQHHRNVGQNVNGQVGVSVRSITDADARAGGGVSIGRTERTYEALNRADQTGRIIRTLVQVGYSGNTSVAASASVATPGLGNPGAVSAGGLPVRLGGVSATMGDHGVLAAFRTVETDGKITPEFTYMDIEYRSIDLYEQYVRKNNKVWESFYGKDNLEKNLEKLHRESEPNQRFSERWRLSPEGAHKLRSYLALAKIQQAAARGDSNVDTAELKKIEAEEISKFAAQMLEDRSLWDPLGAYVVEVNSKERAIGPNFLIQAQQVTRSVADAELDWLGGTSAGMNSAARLRADREAERKRAHEVKTEFDEIARTGGQFIPAIEADPEPLLDVDSYFDSGEGRS